MMIIAEFFMVILKVLWAFVTAGAKWVVRPKEKSVAGQVCVITGAGSGLGRLFAKEFARRRAVLVLWDINSQSNEETAEMVREIYRELDSPTPKDGECTGCYFWTWKTLRVFMFTPPVSTILLFWHVLTPAGYWMHVCTYFRL